MSLFFKQKKFNKLKLYIMKTVISKIKKTIKEYRNMGSNYFYLENNLVTIIENSFPNNKKYLKNNKNKELDKKEPIYTLENVQVDWKGLNEYQILSMHDVVLKHGYGSWDDYYGTPLTNKNRYFRQSEKNGKFYKLDFDENKYTITYRKFMKLFGYKK